VYITELHWIDGSCCFLSLFSCQGSVFKAGRILLAPHLPVKGFDRRNRRCSSHRLVRLSNPQACVSDVRLLLSCQ
jgi:hypothetical protein